MTHLWEVDHPYYCNEGDFYGGDISPHRRETICHYRTIREFLASEQNNDADLNLLFRFDWKLIDETGEDAEIYLYFMIQRKGYNRTVIIDRPNRDDESLLREYLQGKLQYLLKLWEPLTP